MMDDTEKIDFPIDRIESSVVVVTTFGAWPSFHDCEERSLHMRTKYRESH